MTDTSTSVRTSVVVEVPPDRAFAVFTEDMGSWWSPDHHILQAPLASMVVEPRVGGSIYDVGTDGSECRWGTVLAYEPPDRFVFGWNITPQWQVESDPARASEVEVRFVPEEGGRTRVELEHRHLDRHGEGWEDMREAVASPGGWGSGLRRFAARLEGATLQP
jgi:uncharacterized protein YndB with AHSA1/START domain